MCFIWIKYGKHRLTHSVLEPDLFFHKMSLGNHTFKYVLNNEPWSLTFLHSLPYTDILPVQYLLIFYTLSYHAMLFQTGSTICLSDVKLV